MAIRFKKASTDPYVSTTLALQNPEMASYTMPHQYLHAYTYLVGFHPFTFQLTIFMVVDQHIRVLIYLPNWLSTNPLKEVTIERVCNGACDPTIYYNYSIEI